MVSGWDKIKHVESPLIYHKGRGALSNPDGRFEQRRHEMADDGWGGQGDEDQSVSKPKTQLLPDQAKTVINRNRSPDVPFEYSVNPYRGCEHGCIYCFARPTHSYLGLSAGLDFETRLFYKVDAAECFAAELQKPSYRCKPIALGINTDAYQPVERELQITRGLLHIALDFRQPVSIVTKSGLILRDLDVLAEMARYHLVSIMISLTSLRNEIKRTLEPRAASALMRLRVIRQLSDAGVPVGVLVAPVIPVITDHELEKLLAHAARAGAESAGYVFLRLPYEVKELFREWLQQHYPEKAAHVMSVIRQSRGGKDYGAQFGRRMRGTGPFADLLRQRFQLACRRFGLNTHRQSTLDCSQFRIPEGNVLQPDLFTQ